MRSDNRWGWLVCLAAVLCLLLVGSACNQEQEPSPGTPDAAGAFQDAAASLDGAVGAPDALELGDGAVPDAMINDAMVNDAMVNDAMVNDAGMGDAMTNDAAIGDASPTAP